MEGRGLMAWGPYGPYICTVLSSRANHGRVVCRRTWTYSIWCVEDGAVVWERPGKATMIPAPCAIFMSPECPERLSITERSRWRAVAYNAVYVPYKSQNEPGENDMRIQAGNEKQPPALEIWGVELPWLAPPELVPSALSMAHFCQSLWWQGDLAYVRANHRLGQWILSFLAWVTAGQTIEEHDWMARAEHAARERLNAGRLSVGEMAKIAGVSRQHLYRSFRRLRGRSPSEFLHDMWLEQAKALLEETNKPAKKVGEFCGFRFASNFSREFKQRTGLSPLAWRRTHRR